MKPYGFVPLSKSLPYWPNDLFGQLDFLDEIGVRDFQVQKAEDMLSISGTLIWSREISFNIPGLEGFSVAFLSENGRTAVPFEVKISPDFAVHLRDLSVSLRLNTDLLRPVRKQNGKWENIRDDKGNLKPAELQFKKIELVVDQDGD